ncbi:MAG: pentapeptide repeat-containing protein [Nitrospirae bacterium]|nr:pentapeptide repeat-containing protein [Nitrospirota bacterium]
MTREETWKALREMGVVKGEMPEGSWNLTGAKMAGYDLKKFYLKDANLQRTDLRGADLYKAYLRGAKLNEAILSRASMSRADLYKSNLTRATLFMTDLMEADLSLATLVEADLLWANLYGADLNEADLTLANLTNANLHNASLRNCLLREASLVGTNLTIANATESDFTGASIKDITSCGWTIKDVKADYIYFTTETYNKADKEKHRLDMAPGEFEALFSSHPAIELVADTTNLHDDFLSVKAILDHVKSSHPDLNLKVSGVSFLGSRFILRITISKDEFLARSAVLIGAALQSCLKGNLLSKTFIPALNPPESHYQISPKKQNLTVHFRKVAMHLINSDGSVYSGGEVVSADSKAEDEGNR